MTLDQIIRRLRNLAEIAGSQAALAKQIGVTPSYLSDVLTERRDPGPAILSYLGLTKTYTREKTSP